MCGIVPMATIVANRFCAGESDCMCEVIVGVLGFATVSIISDISCL